MESPWKYYPFDSPLPLRISRGLKLARGLKFASITLLQAAKINLNPLKINGSSTPSRKTKATQN
jgi:hypothetical protein